MSFARRALAGVAWNYGGSAGLMLIQVGAAATTARLIVPASFGAYAAAQAAVGILSYFTFTTIGTGLARSETLSSSLVGTAFALSIVAGSVCFAILWLLAGTWADTWHAPQATGLIQILSVALLFNGLAGVPLAVLRRRFRFRAAALSESLAQIGGTAFGVGLALFMHSASALAFGQIFAAAGTFVVSTILVRREIPFAFDWMQAKGILTFAGQLTFLYLGTYLLNTAPTWYISRSFGVRTLGIYSRASLIAGLPLTYLSAGVAKVLFPLYGQLRSDLARTRTLATEGLILMTGLTWPVLGALAGSAAVVVRVLLGGRWASAGPMLELCAVAAAANLSCGVLTTAAEALGWIRSDVARQATFCALILLSIAAAAFGHLSVLALLGFVAGAQWLAYGLTLLPFIRRGVIEKRVAAKSNVVHLAFAMVVFVASKVSSVSFRSTPVGVQIIAQVLVVLLTIAIVAGVAREKLPVIQTLERRLGIFGLLRRRAVAVVTFQGSR